VAVWVAYTSLAATVRLATIGESPPWS
jgi:hypothetical protein